MFETVSQDYRRYHQAATASESRFAGLRAGLSYGFIAVCLYRYGRWARCIRPRWLSLPFKVLYLVLKVPVHLLLGIDISTAANIGPGLYIGHFGCIFLHGDAGKNLSVGQGVTIGFKGAGKSDGWPTLGDDVYLGTGAKIIGRIFLGNGVVVGANTVVTKDVPDGMRVVGAAVRMSPMAQGEHADVTGNSTDCRD